MWHWNVVGRAFHLPLRASRIARLIRRFEVYMGLSLFSRLPVLAALGIAACAFSTASMAQQSGGTPGTVKSNHGAWSIVCDKPAGASTEQCALMQNVIAEDRPEVGLSVVVLKTADRKAKILRVLAPLGVLLPNGLGLNVDGKDIGRAYFVRCFTDGCYAEVVLEDELLKTFRAGATATFIVFQSPEEGIGIPVDLKGFGEGYDALP
ncbi:invasion associated locus B family protein [Sinorhizobium alkalisoli]